MESDSQTSVSSSFNRAVPDVDGVDMLVAKHSTVRADGTPQQQMIDGVHFRPTRPVPHDDGIVTEIARADWDLIDKPVVHTHLTTTEPGRIRAWGLHAESSDRLFVVKGLVSIVVYDARRGSPTRGSLNEFKVSERNPGLLVIPPQLFHGWKVIGTEEAYIINMPSSMYAHDNPDALDMPYDDPRAEELVPWRW